jgi:predicted DsbA family dithiol-disulfide isomerase
MAYAFLFSVWGVVVSVFMFTVSETQVHALCLYCVLLYLTSFAALGISWSALGGLSSIGPAIKTDWDGLGKQKSFAYVLAVLFLGSLAWVFAHPWANAKWYVFNPPGPQAIPTPGGGDPKEIARTQILVAPYFNPGPGGAYCKGANDPVLTLVEFGDLECPACRAASWTIDPWVDQHANEVRLCYRHYPLDMACNPEIKHPKHQFACETARAAEAAGLQGKFWEYHDAVYARFDDKGAFINEPDLKHEALVDRAKKLGLNATQFEKDMDDQNVVDKVLDDVTMGNQVGIGSTPTYFVNGRLIAGGRDTRYLDTWLEMAKKGELGPPPKSSSSNP